ncbi:hypothetical protein LINPERPRIM_LOCUS30689 [Linum perenne]
MSSWGVILLKRSVRSSKNLVGDFFGGIWFEAVIDAFFVRLMYSLIGITFHYLKFVRAINSQFRIGFPGSFLVRQNSVLVNHHSSFIKFLFS